MSVQKLAILGAIILASLGVVGIGILAALERPLDDFASSFIQIGGFLVTILTLGTGLERIATQNRQIAKNVNGNQRVLVEAVARSGGVSDERLAEISTDANALLDEKGKGN